MKWSPVSYQYKPTNEKLLKISYSFHPQEHFPKKVIVSVDLSLNGEASGQAQPFLHRLQYHSTMQEAPTLDASSIFLTCLRS